MKTSKKFLSIGLALTFSLLGANQSFADIDTSSPFYYANKTRQAYINLTDSQRADLDRINTDNNKVLTIEEVLNSGNFTLPIKKGVDWVYPFMIDRNKDGQVGENYWGENSDSSNTSSDNNSGLASKEEEPSDKEETEDPVGPDKDKSETENPADNNEPTAEEIEDLRKAIEDSKLQILAVDLLFKRAPNISSANKGYLNKLVSEAKELIKEGLSLIHI